MAKKIPPPAIPPEHPDRAIDCEFYLEPAVNDIVDIAIEAGWTYGEIDAALLGLVRRRLLARVEQERLDSQMAKARRH